MYGYGYRYSAKPSVFAFNPLTDIAGLSLYLNKNTNVNTKIAADFVAANSEYLSSASIDFDKSTSFSIGGWFYDNGVNFNRFGKWLNTGNQRSFHMNGSLFYVSRDGTSATTVSVNAGTIAPNQWNFLVCVFDYENGLIKVSKNNEAFTTAVQTGCFDSSTEDFHFGKINASSYYDGKIDSPFFYDKALSLAEVTALYNLGNGTSYPNLTTAQKVDLVSWWDLNEESGTRNDAHGTNNLTENNTVSYSLGKVQDTSTVGERVWNWIDQSPNAYIFSNDTVTDQPLLESNDIVFDGVDDSLEKTIANVYSGDSSGIIFFSGYFDSSAANYIIASADSSATTSFLGFGLLPAGEFFVQARTGGVTDTITSTATILNGAFYYGYIKSNGTSYEFNVNGSVSTPLIVGGTNRGHFFADIGLRDNLSLSSLLYSTPIYSPAKVNKIIYSNDYTIDTAPILNFMSNPAN